MLSRLILAAVCLCAAGCGWEGIPGSGVALTEQRPVESFEQLVVRGALEVTVRRSDEWTVTVEGDDNLVPLITTTVSGETLTVSSTASMRPKLPLKVSITAPALSDLSVSGASQLEAIDLQQSGPLSLDVSGASELVVSGDGQQLTVQVSGASEADLTALSVAQAEVTVTGASSLDLRASESITGRASGASTVIARGGRVEVSSSGASSVRIVEEEP